MNGLLRIVFAALVAALGVSFSGAAQPQPAESDHESAAAAHLHDEAGIVTCSNGEYLFGVAYVDGSYMERIFLVRDEKGPRLEVNFRTPEIWPGDDRSEESRDLPPMPFTLELWVPLSRYAVPSGSQWQVPQQEWQTSLRFKYSNWYGEIGRREGQWKIDWQGFRRPMLPGSVKESWQEVCRLLAES